MEMCIRSYTSGAFPPILLSFVSTFMQCRLKHSLPFFFCFVLFFAWDIQVQIVNRFCLASGVSLISGNSVIKAEISCAFAS